MSKEMREKAFIIRMPKDMWKFLKIASVHEEVSMNQIVNNLVFNYKQKKEKKLTNSDKMIS